VNGSHVGWVAKRYPSVDAHLSTPAIDSHPPTFPPTAHGIKSIGSREVQWLSTSCTFIPANGERQEITLIPQPCYTLINTSIGEDPAVVVVNSSLRTFDQRETFPWHLRITIDCLLLGANGMPTSEEVDILNQLEDHIETPLQVGENAIFLARITARGERVLLYRIQDPEKANDALRSLVSPPSGRREWEYRMESDAHWELAQPEFQLLEHDPI
jgi:hypothetical protein